MHAERGCWNFRLAHGEEEYVLILTYFHSILDTLAGAGSAQCVQAAGAVAGRMSVVVWWRETGSRCREAGRAPLVIGRDFDFGKC